MGLVNERHRNEDMQKLARLLALSAGDVDAKTWQQANTDLDALFHADSLRCKGGGFLSDYSANAAAITCMHSVSRTAAVRHPPSAHPSSCGYSKAWNDRRSIFRVGFYCINCRSANGTRESTTVCAA